MIHNVVVVGGGTAGWLCAAIIAAEYHSKNTSIHVSLVESPDVSTIGVGEGTWPTMRMTLKKIGISETEFLKTCNASFKQGSKFVGWKNGSPHDFYYHPFTVPAGFSETNIYAVWKEYFSNLSFDAVANIQAQVCELGLAPKQITTPEYGGALNYGYHLDAGKFSELLKLHATEKLGVNHILDHVTEIHSSENGDISTLTTKGNGKIPGDLFVDCTGTHCLLLGDHYNIPFVDCSRYSINDRALAVQVPYESDDSPIASATIGTAKSAGWTWDIGLSSRRGVGYVYSSAHLDNDKAEKELFDHLRQTVTEKQLEGLSPRLLKINAGYRSEFWHKNCVAVGMSAGFIEPLEASALALVELSASMIRDELPRSREEMTVVAKRFNTIFHYRWQRIIEFLKLHYILSDRKDTDYWRDVVAEEGVPDSLKDALKLWRHRSPYYRDFLQTEEVFPSASYQYVLYGMGFESQLETLDRPSFTISRGREVVLKEAKKLEQYRSLVPTTRNLLSAIDKHGLKKI